MLSSFRELFVLSQQCQSDAIQTNIFLYRKVVSAAGLIVTCHAYWPGASEREEGDKKTLAAVGSLNTDGSLNKY